MPPIKNCCFRCALWELLCLLVSVFPKEKPRTQTFTFHINKRCKPLSILSAVIYLGFTVWFEI